MSDTAPRPQPLSRQEQPASRRSAPPEAPSPQALERARQVFGERSSIFTPEYQALLRLLRAARQEAGLTQAQLGERLGQPQAIISKCERGERRLDAVELRAYCTALGIFHLRLLERLEEELSGPEGASEPAFAAQG